jgi:hypothetical protein
MLAIVVGVIVGVAIVYAISFINNKFGYIPFARKLGRNDVRAFPPRVSFQDEPAEAIVESVDGLSGKKILPGSGEILRVLSRAKSEHGSKTSSLEDAVQKYQAENKCRLVLINQKPGSVGGGFLGVGGAPSCIGLDEAAKLVDILGDIPNDMPLHIILRSCGGTLQAAEVISHALRNHKGEISVFVSQYAQSAATMIALNATHLFMNANAFLTPTDPQIMGYSAHTILKLAGRGAQLEGVAGVMVAAARDLAKGALARATEQLLKVIAKDSPLAERLMGQNGHDQPIFATELAPMLKSLTIGIPSSVQEIIKLDETAPLW